MRNTLFGCFLVLIIVLNGCSTYSNNHRIDHIILAINNLNSGANQMRRLTGIEPVYGGKHPGSFTQNALLSVGENTYLEILAPKNDLDSIPDFFKKLNYLTPVGWAISSMDIEKTKSSITSIGFKSGDIVPGSRITEKGERLDWKTCAIIETTQGNIFPFFISWDSPSIHPSRSSPRGCILNRMVLKSSKTETIEKLLDGLNISNSEIEVESDNSEGIEIVLETPKGEVRISKKLKHKIDL